MSAALRRSSTHAAFIETQQLPVKDTQSFRESSLHQVTRAKIQWAVLTSDLIGHISLYSCGSEGASLRLLFSLSSSQHLNNWTHVSPISIILVFIVPSLVVKKQWGCFQHKPAENNYETPLRWKPRSSAGQDESEPAGKLFLWHLRLVPPGS